MTKPAASGLQDGVDPKSSTKKTAAEKNGSKVPKRRTSAKDTQSGSRKKAKALDGASVNLKKKSASTNGKKSKNDGVDKPKVMRKPSAAPRKPKKKDPNAFRVIEKETQTGLHKCTQTRDWTFPTKETKMESLMEEAVAKGDFLEEISDVRPVDIRIPQLTLADILKYATDHSCEIRIS